MSDKSWEPGMLLKIWKNLKNWKLGRLKAWKLENFENMKNDPWDMLNNFCFHVYAQKSLFIAENCNVFFGTASPSPVTLDVIELVPSWKLRYRVIGHESTLSTGVDNAAIEEDNAFSNLVKIWHSHGSLLARLPSLFLSPAENPFQRHRSRI